MFDAQNAERGAAALRQKYRDTEADNAHWFFTLLPDFANELLKRLLSERAGHNIGGAREGEVEYDILPTGPKAWDGFLLFESRLTLYHCTQKPRAKGEPPLAGVQLRVESKKCSEPIDTGFHEPFYAYGKPEAPFFVTKSGKVFQLQRPEKGQPRVEKVWDDSKRPVRAILDDTDGGRTFVAGPDLPQGAGRWFWFELANKPEPKPYDPAAVKVEAEEPLKPALAFARFLLKEGKLKAK